MPNHQSWFPCVVLKKKCIRCTTMINLPSQYVCNIFQIRLRQKLTQGLCSCLFAYMWIRHQRFMSPGLSLIPTWISNYIDHIVVWNYLSILPLQWWLWGPLTQFLWVWTKTIHMCTCSCPGPWNVIKNNCNEKKTSITMMQSENILPGSKVPITH